MMEQARMNLADFLKEFEPLEPLLVESEPASVTDEEQFFNDAERWAQRAAATSIALQFADDAFGAFWLGLKRDPAMMRLFLSLVAYHRERLAVAASQPDMVPLPEAEAPSFDRQLARTARGPASERQTRALGMLCRLALANQEPARTELVAILAEEAGLQAICSIARDATSPCQLAALQVLGRFPTIDRPAAVESLIEVARNTMHGAWRAAALSLQGMVREVAAAKRATEPALASLSQRFGRVLEDIVASLIDGGQPLALNLVRPLRVGLAPGMAGGGRQLSTAEADITAEVSLDQFGPPKGIWLDLSRAHRWANEYPILKISDPSTLAALHEVTWSWARPGVFISEEPVSEDGSLRMRLGVGRGEPPVDKDALYDLLAHCEVTVGVLDLEAVPERDSSS